MIRFNRQIPEWKINATKLFLFSLRLIKLAQCTSPFISYVLAIRRAIPCPGDITDRIAHVEADRKTNDKQNVIFIVLYAFDKLPCLHVNCHRMKISYL